MMKKYKLKTIKQNYYHLFLEKMYKQNILRNGLMMYYQVMIPLIFLFIKNNKSILLLAGILLIGKHLYVKI
jgi:hypothetical protein